MPVLVDTNVLPDVAIKHPQWFDCSVAGLVLPTRDAKRYREVFSGLRPITRPLRPEAAM